jgi:putative phage-type endonuclease
MIRDRVSGASGGPRDERALPIPAGEGRGAVIIVPCEQGTEAWYEARRGIPTSSEFACILARGKGWTKYLWTLAAERLTGKCADGFENASMRRGKALEEEARAVWSFTTGQHAEPVGFVRNEIAGASPDGLIGADGLIEIKTRLPHLHFELLEGGRVPNEHLAQLQGQMWVTGRQWCEFVSYWPGLPLFVRTVERDDEAIERIRLAVEEFSAELEVFVAKYAPEKAA